MKKQVCILLLLILLPITPVNATSFGWDLAFDSNDHASNGFSFKAGTVRVAAKIGPEQSGGYLPRVTTQAENIIDSLDFWLDDLDGAKLGGTDQGGEGCWQWLNKEGDFSYTSWEQHSLDDFYN